MKICDISHTNLLDYDLVYLYKTGARRKKTKCIEQLWLKYQPLVKSFVSQYFRQYCRVSSYEEEDLIHDCFFEFPAALDRIILKRINSKFSFGSWIYIYISAFISEKVKETCKDLKYLQINTGDNYTGVDSVTSPYTNAHDGTIETDVNRLFTTFKKKVNKRDQRILNCLERWNGRLNDSEMARKLKFKSLSALIYHRNKLKIKYVQFMSKHGYRLEI